MDRKKLIVIAIGVVLAASLVLLMRHRLAPSSWSPPDRLAEFAEEVRAHYRLEPTVSASDRGAMIGAFSAADILIEVDGNAVSRDDEVLNPIQRELLLETIAEMIELRALGDAEAYAEWMRNRGYRLKDEELTRGWKNRFRLHAGRELTAEDSAWDIFRLSFEGELLKGRGGQSQPTAIVASPSAMEIWATKKRDSGSIGLAFPSVFSARLADSGSSAQFADDSNRMLWANGQTYGGRPHWAPPVTADELLEANGEVLCAQVHCIFRVDGGGVIPTVFFVYFDPGARRWHFEQMMYTSTYSLDIRTGPEL